MNDSAMNDSMVSGSGGDDSAVLGLVGGSLGGVHMRRPVDEVAARGRRSRTRRRSIAGAVAVGALGAGLAIALPSTSVSGQSATANDRPPSQVVDVDMAAWSVHTNADSTVTISMREFKDQAKLEQVLARAGVRAIVTEDARCGANIDGMAAIGEVMGVPVHKADGEEVVTITPSAMPAGSVLDIHFYDVGTPRAMITVSLLARAPSCK